MNDPRRQLEQLLSGLGMAASVQLAFRGNPGGQRSAWLVLATSADLPRFAEMLQAGGGRLATTTIYRPDPIRRPKDHEIAYHFVLDGMTVTAKVRLAGSDALPSIARLFPNADWEEREMMELTGIAIPDHPNPRRIFLDESIEAGVFDRYVPFSDFTNAAQHTTVWNRIREANRSSNQAKKDSE